MECFDAAPGGHGRAYCQFSEETIAELARWSMTKKCVYVWLSLKYGIAVDADERCPLYRVSLPEGQWWHEIPRLGGRSHITLEEAKACNSAMLARLGRLDGVRRRLVLAGDNAAQIGAYQKGRSSSGKLNAKCHRAASVILAGGMLPFFR